MKIKLSKSQWQEIGNKAGWTKTANKTAQIIPDDGYADGGEPYTDEEMDLIRKQDVALRQKIEAIKAENDRPKKIQDLMDLYVEIHPQASPYELNTLMGDIGQISTEEINRYIDKYVYSWHKPVDAYSWHNEVSPISQSKKPEQAPKSKGGYNI